VSRANLSLLLALSAIWGSSFLFIKLGVDELEPAVVAFGRLLVGVAILLPIAAARGGLGLLRPHLRTVAVLGALNNALPFWLLGFAETRIDSGLAAVIQAAAPIFTVVLAIRLDPTQRATGARLAGIGVGFVGVALLVGMQSGGQVVGALAVLGAALCYAVSALFAGTRGRSVPTLHLAAGQLACGTLLIGSSPSILRQLVKQVTVVFCCRARLVEAVNIFAQDVHGGPEALCIQSLGDTNRVLQRFARDVALGDAADDGPGRVG